MYDLHADEHLHFDACVSHFNGCWRFGAVGVSNFSFQWGARTRAKNQIRN